jgi:hypothetical protein
MPPLTGVQWPHQRSGDSETLHEKKDVLNERRGFLPSLPVRRILDLLLQCFNPRLKFLVLSFQVFDLRLTARRLGC